METLDLDELFIRAKCEVEIIFKSFLVSFTQNDFYKRFSWNQALIRKYYY